MARLKGKFIRALKHWGVIIQYIKQLERLIQREGFFIKKDTVIAPVLLIFFAEFWMRKKKYGRICSGKERV